MQKSVHKSCVPDLYHIIITIYFLFFCSLIYLLFSVLYVLYVPRAPEKPQQMPCVCTHLVNKANSDSMLYLSIK